MASGGGEGEVAGPFSQPPGDEGPPEEDVEDPDDGAEPLPEGFSGDVLVRPPGPGPGPGPGRPRP